MLFCCLACFREGVWKKYTPQDVARWQAETPAHPPVLPAITRPASTTRETGMAPVRRVSQSNAPELAYAESEVAA
ncbi:hypothetical protein PK28_18250 (plasmid) [Hymenobacter sp. DG25B]|nr:hypothetical protein PK28_18250 [Hymenobacter sp. DG25B]